MATGQARVATVVLMSALVPIGWASAQDALSPPAAADSAPQRIIVTGSPSAQRVADAPFAISVIDADEIRSAGPMVNLSESLARVPGLVVNNRNNYAQDLQISARGFGARAGFGVRGLRLYTDGIPATMPDGQGQVAHFDLAGAQRIEVLRGPFSVLYGNSSGGVIALFSAPVTQRRIEIAADAGRYGFRQARVSAALPIEGGFDLQAGASTMESEGFRPQSAARRSLANLRLGWRGEHDTVVVIANHQDLRADDPLGLDRESFDTDPLQTVELATQFDTRKTVNQTQLGATWTHRFAGDGAWRDVSATAYAGERGVSQFLSIAPAVQANPSHGGGFIDFDRRYRGLDLRTRLAIESADLVLGAAVETQTDDRRGYENFTGDPDAPTLGVQGALRRNEVNEARSEDLYAQLEWRVSPNVAALGGVRNGRVELSSSDRFLDNGDDSGDLAFRYTNPVLGLRWQPAAGLTLHASAARGFESPTLGELAYRSDGNSGFNTALKPQRSRQLELGAKWRAAGWSVDGAVFLVDTRDEIGVQTNAGGRQSFQNVGDTRRKGAELAGTWQIAPAWRTQIALTWLDARYRDDFLVCAAVPCFEPTETVPAGNRVAGTSNGSGWAELVWRTDAQGEFAVEWRASAKTAVNDRNSDFAGGWSAAGMRYSRWWMSAAGRIELIARVDNLLDRRYAGSVIVNEGNGRFFETASPRAWWVGLRWQPPV
jgi:iron complex outermembrane recepter protein